MLELRVIALHSIRMEMKLRITKDRPLMILRRMATDEWNGIHSLLLFILMIISII